MKKSTKYLLAFLPAVLIVIALAIFNPLWFSNDGWWQRAITLVLVLGAFSGVALRMLDPNSDD